MGTDPKETSLWKAAFANEHCKTSTQFESRAKLLSELQKLDRHVADLLSKIPEDCKGLTLHDITHVHQLWDVASRLCGPEYPINPLEGFVLGAAFLVHDAGLTAASYPNGLKGLKASSLYRDLVSNALKRADPDRSVDSRDIDDAPKEIAEHALFVLLRNLHADRAEKLLDRSYEHPITNVSFTLIDVDLLFDIGDVIGKVAASHNWSIRKVDEMFVDPLPPQAAYPDWTVDTVKLACILRAADACAIDERRARTMAFIIENPRGVSRSHWAFQKLLNPGYLPEFGEALVFSSKRPFAAGDMDSWWVAYDAISVADGELRACDRLLKRRAGQRGHDIKIPLKARRVEGAGDPETLSQYIRVDGWRPVDTSARINDPIAVIESLGGKNLYGDDDSAPLRELLQNAADAVRLRRRRKGYDPSAGEFPGSIEIVIAKPNTIAEPWTLTIIDDGVGMPEDVLTGEFIEFGKSLWRSDRLASLYPGVAEDKNFRPTGRFGIGFYASFIIADDVKVMTKPYREGDANRLVLHFKNGVTGRPEMRPYDAKRDGPWPYSASTLIELKLKDLAWIANFASHAVRDRVFDPIPIEDERYWTYFSRSLETLVFALDVKTTMRGPFIDSFTANKPDVFKLNNAEFSSEWNRVFQDASGGNLITPALQNLIDVIGNSDQSRSRGCVSTTSMLSQGIVHIGGFTVFRSMNSTVHGIVESLPVTTNRRGSKLIESKDAFRSWGERQLQNPYLTALEPAKLSEALIRLWDCQLDIADHYFLWDLYDNMIFFRDMKFDEPPTIFFNLITHPFEPKRYMMGQPHVSPFAGKAIELSHDFTIALGNNFGQPSSEYNRIKFDDCLDTAKDRTAFGRLVKKIRDLGFEIKIEGPASYIIGTYTGPEGGFGFLKDPTLKAGSNVQARGIVLRAKRKPTVE